MRIIEEKIIYFLLIFTGVMLICNNIFLVMSFTVRTKKKIRFNDDFKPVF